MAVYPGVRGRARRRNAAGTGWWYGMLGAVGSASSLPGG